jgi:hypothetical protein
MTDGIQRPDEPVAEVHVWPAILAPLGYGLIVLLIADTSYLHQT